MRTAIILSIVWTVLLGAISCAGLWYIMEGPSGGGGTREQRASQLGSGMGVFGGIGYGGIWMWWFLRRKQQAGGGKSNPAPGEPKKRRAYKPPPGFDK